MTDAITSSDDIIDSRDIIARIEWIEQELEEDAERPVWGAVGDDGPLCMNGHERAHLELELAHLKALEKEAEPYCPDWRYGASLIRDSYFTDYAEQLADDIGAIDHNANWPVCHIDWDAAAASLQQDYTSVEFDGVTYWVR